jgi:hypothetical protein
VPRSNDNRWIRECEVCGKEFQQSRPGVRTCSRTCGNKLPHNTGGTQVKAGLLPRTCQNPECGKTYAPARENQVACSKACLLKTPSYREAQRRTDMRPERQQVKNEQRRVEISKDPVSRRAENFRQNLRKYGLTPEQYHAKLAGQDDKCMLCGQPAKPGGVRAESKLHVDHDHVTGRNRDLLCGNCNKGLGCFKDDPALLRAAADYVERHRVTV